MDGAELAMRAVLGQQVSVAGARALAGRIVAELGDALPAALADPAAGITHLFPEPAAIAQAGDEALPLPNARREALRGLAGALLDEKVSLNVGSDRVAAVAKLLELPGIGPWTASYVAMRALGDPDVFLPTDLGVRNALSRLGHSGEATTLARRWRPWRSYAVRYLWESLNDPVLEKTKEKGVMV